MDPHQVLFYTHRHSSLGGLSPATPGRPLPICCLRRVVGRLPQLSFITEKGASSILPCGRISYCPFPLEQDSTGRISEAFFSAPSGDVNMSSVCVIVVKNTFFALRLYHWRVLSVYRNVLQVVSLPHTFSNLPHPGLHMTRFLKFVIISSEKKIIVIISRCALTIKNPRPNVCRKSNDLLRK